MNSFAFIVLLTLLAIASIFDLRERRIPNWLTYPGISVSVLWIDWTVAFYFMASLLALLVSKELIGAGDIKLSLLVASWSHNFNWSGYWLFSAFLVAGIGGLIAMARRDRRAIAFAPYIATGFLASNLLL